MRVIIVGSGEVGRHIAERLSGEKHDVTVVECDPVRSADLNTQLDALVVLGNGASPRLLRELDAGEADLVLAVTDSDEVNLLSAAAAHQLGARRTLARVRDSDSFGHDNGFVRDVLGVDQVIDPERATADDIAETLLVPGAVHIEYFAEERIALAEVSLHAESPLVGQVVAERKRVRPHSIVGVLRRGRPTIPAADQRLEEGDHVFVAAAREDVAETVAYIDGDARRVRDAVILGGGKIGFSLARRLDGHQCAVKVIEADRERARHLAEKLPGTVVLEEHELSKEMLMTHGVGDVAAFVACAGDDRTNLLAALHAKQLGTHLCLAVVSSEQFVPLVDALGVDAAFSLRLTTAEAILRFVRSESVRAVHLTLSGAEILDLHADPGSPIEGAPAATTGLLEGCEVGAILRGDDVVVPDAEERIRAGDRVLLFRLQGAAPKVERAFDA